MKVPNSEKAKIRSEKLYQYLLSETHLIGKYKAKFFNKIGFNKRNVKELKINLKEHLKSSEVIKVDSSSFGVKYIIEGKIKSKISNNFYKGCKDN